MNTLTKLELGAGLVLVVAAVYLAKKTTASGVGQAVGQGAVDVVTGTITGIGDGVGVPRTNADKCSLAIAEGRSWDASFYCPAGTFIKYMLDGSKLPPFDPGSGGNTW